MMHLLEQILIRVDRGEKLALCAVVEVHGSTPQKRGAMMLVLNDGKTLGTLGGGCVEAEVRTRALRLIDSGQSELMKFSLDHDYGWDDGLVCGGVMDIAVQIIDSAASAKSVRNAVGSLHSRSVAILKMPVRAAGEALVEHEVEIAPSATLILAGAGHVARAVGELTMPLGFDLVVIDDRAEYASPDRFPSARCIVGEIESELKKIPIDAQTYIVILTRGHRHDGQALAAVVNSSAKYIGLIGSRRKIKTIFDDLQSKGFEREKLLKVHAPIGLDIGAISPEEIAVSIAAELIAVRREKSINTGAMRISEAEMRGWLSREKKL